MNILGRLIAAIRRWLNPTGDLVLDPGIGQALAAFRDDRDWFLWECEQIRNNGYAPWLDPYRYEGTEFAYPLPSREQLWKNFEASRLHAVERYGQERVNRMTAWGDKHYDGKYDPESSYSRSADPIGLAMAEYIKTKRLH